MQCPFVLTTPTDIQFRDGSIKNGLLQIAVFLYGRSVFYVFLPLALKMPHFTSMWIIGTASLLPGPFQKGPDNCTALCVLPAPSVTVDVS